MRVIILGIVSLVTMMSAAADRVNDAISTYNAVVSAGDTDAKVSAALELGEAAMAAEVRDDAALLVFEAAKTLCLSNACASAKPYANWAMSAGGNFEGVAFEEFVALSRYADWRADTNKATRAALDQALTQLVATEPSLMSVVMFQRRYNEDLIDGEWESGAVAAQHAADHFAPVRDVIGQQWSRAKLASISSAYNSEPDIEHLYAFARLEQELNMLYSLLDEAETEDPGVAWLNDNRYAAQAWRLAAEAYFISTSHRKPIQAQILEDEIGAIVSYQTGEPEPVDPNALQLCAGEMRMRPALSYPGRVERRGQYGAVIMELTLKDGKVASVTPLAAVPSEGFKDRAAKTIAKWTWKTSVPKRDIGVTCKMDRDQMILPIIFALK